MGVGLKIKKHLVEKGITAKNFSEKIKENRTQVNAYLNEKLKPSVVFLYKTSEFFPDLDLNYLFREKKELNDVEEVYEKPPDKIIEDIEMKLLEISKRVTLLKNHLSQK